MTPFWNKFRAGLAEGIKSAAANTEEIRRVGSVEYTIYKLKKDIKTTEAELGRRTHHLFKQGTAEWVAADEATRELITRLESLGTTLQEKQREADDLLKDEEESARD